MYIKPSKHGKTPTSFRIIKSSAKSTYKTRFYTNKNLILPSKFRDEEVDSIGLGNCAKRRGCDEDTIQENGRATFVSRFIPANLVMHISFNSFHLNYTL